MVNLVEEVLQNLTIHKKTFEDIEFIDIALRWFTYNEDAVELMEACDVTALPKELGYVVHMKECNPISLDSFKKLEYNDRSGEQLLFGNIVFKDGSWVERSAFKGVEYWEYRVIPKWY